MKKIIFIFLLSTTIISGVYAQDKKLENVSIQLKWFYQYQFAGIFVAKEKGFYEEAGLNVSIKERDPKKNNILQVVDGESEYGVADSVILRYRAQGSNLRVLATIFQHNAMVLMSKKGSGIVSPYEMKGKSISFQKGLDDSIISSLFAFANIEEDEYIRKPMDFTHMDFINGSVDISEAYLSIEPYWLKKKYNIDVNIIDPKNYGIDFYGDLIFTTQEEIDEHPKRVEAFKNATLKGWAYALKHQDEAIKIILDKYNTRDLTYEQLLYEARVTENLIATKYIPLGDVKKERFQVLATLYSNEDLDKKALDNAVQTIIYNPNAKQNWFEAYFHQIMIAVVLLFILVLFLFFYNRRLNYLVNKKTEELQKSTAEQEILLSLFDIGESVLFKWNNDETWSIDYVSKSVKNLLGYEKKEFMDKVIDYPSCVYKEDIDRVAEEVKVAGGSAKDYFKHEPYRVVTKDNKVKWVIDHTVVQRDKDDNITHFVGYIHDITEMKEQYVATTKKAYVDGLTKVYNRNKFDEIFAEEFKRTQRYNNPFSIAILDIDKFKNVNDTYGHLIGDEVLITLAQTINNNIRETDTVARWGGEEFVILFKNTSITVAKQVSQKLKSKIEENKHAIAGTITASFGCTAYKDGDSEESIFKRCDEALYMAKENGRNRVEVL